MPENGTSSYICQTAASRNLSVPSCQSRFKLIHYPEGQDMPGNSTLKWFQALRCLSGNRPTALSAAVVDRTANGKVVQALEAIPAQAEQVMKGVVEVTSDPSAADTGGLRF